MIFRAIAILVLSSFCFGAINNNFNIKYNNINYEQELLDNSVLYLGGVYGFGLKNSRRNYYGANVLIKVSKYSFIGVELLKMNSKLKGALSSPNNILIGSNTYLMYNMIFGLKVSPNESLTISPYIGTGANVAYVDYVSIGTFTSGLDITYVASSYLSVTLGYKNIAIFFSPTLDVEHYANIGMKITF